MLGAGREYKDEPPVVGAHRLVPRDAQSQLRVVVRYPVQHLLHLRAVVVVGDGLEEVVERLNRYGFTLGDRRAGSLA